MRVLILPSAAILIAASVLAQVPPCTIQTIAGPSTLFGGDGGPATSAYFSYLSGFRFDPAGNLYIADTGNQRIRKVTPAGIVTTVAGTGIAGYSGDGGPATSAQLYLPVAVSPDNQGNLYIADGDNRIRKIDASGIITTYAGNGTPNFAGDGGPATQAEIQTPIDVLADSKGNVYISDAGNFRVRKVNAQGIISTVAGSGVDEPQDLYPKVTPPRQLGGPATAYSLRAPRTLALDSSSNLYIADYELFMVLKVDGNGVITDFAGNGQAGATVVGQPATSVNVNPFSISFDSNDNLLISSALVIDGGLFSISPTGVVSQIGNYSVLNIAVNGSIIYGQAEDSIYGLGSPATLYAGASISEYSGNGGPATDARFLYPGPIAVDSQGNVYVADSQTWVVRKIGVNGTISVFAATGASGLQSGDGGPATAANIEYIRGIATDINGNVYLTDGATVRKINAQGIISTVVGPDAQLIAASQLAVDPAGNIYEQEEFGVFVFTPAGIRTRQVVSEGNLWTLSPNGTLYWQDYGEIFQSTLGGIPTSPPIPPVQNVSSGNLEFAADSNGDLFISGALLQEFTPDGRLFTIAKLDPGLPYTAGPAGTVDLGYLSSLVSDASGDLYFVDTAHASVRELTAGCPVPAIQPLISNAAVVNAASYDLGADVSGLAAGEIAAMFGANLGPETGMNAPVESGKFPEQFAGVAITVNGYPAPLLFVGQNQVNFVVPFEVEGQRDRAVQITFNGVSSDVYYANEVEADPGIFAIANPDGSANSITNPVAAGSYVVLYGTGQGLATTPQTDGTIDPGSLAMPILPITATIDGQPATVSYAGSAPGLVAGVLQVNVLIPAGVTLTAHSLVITSGALWLDSNKALTIYTQ